MRKSDYDALELRFFNDRIDACIAAVRVYHSLLGLGISREDADRLFELWMERARRLGPIRRNDAPERSDYWTQQLLNNLEDEELTILRRYGLEGYDCSGERPIPIFKPRPMIRKRKRKR